MNQVIEMITEDKALYKAYRRSLSRRSYSDAGQRYAADPLPKLCRLQDELRSGNYKVSGYTSFYVTEPKRREILACHFKDKIVQHALCDNVLNPLLPGICIRDTYAGQKGKGTLYARERLKEQMREFAEVYRGTGYIFKGDVHKFYYSIDHETAKAIMHKTFPLEAWSLIDTFIDSTEGRGVALGNQINTIVSNVYLGELDRYIKNVLRVRHYGRYADDFFILDPDKEHLKWVAEMVEKFLNGVLKLELNPKSQIMPLKNGIRFIGFHFYANEDGEITVKLANDKRRAHRRKFNRMCKLVKAGKITIEALEESQTSWEAHAAYATDADFSYYKARIKDLKNARRNLNEQRIRNRLHSQPPSIQMEADDTQGRRMYLCTGQRAGDGGRV